MTVDNACGRFRGARREIVARHVDALALLGEVTQDTGGRYALVTWALVT